MLRRGGREAEGTRLLSECTGNRTAGSNPALSAIIFLGAEAGEMAERLKAHAWKACIGNTIGGSNPPLSASSTQAAGR